jgi:hypothetical protein
MRRKSNEAMLEFFSGTTFIQVMLALLILLAVTVSLI